MGEYESDAADRVTRTELIHHVHFSSTELAAGEICRTWRERRRRCRLAERTRILTATAATAANQNNGERKCVENYNK